jgi:hypothetical protein
MLKSLGGQGGQKKVQNGAVSNPRFEQPMWDRVPELTKSSHWMRYAAFVMVLCRKDTDVSIRPL